MGYNNNNAGMHFMRYKHYAKDENLEYYDRLAEEEYLRKREEQKAAMEKEPKPNNKKVVEKPHVQIPEKHMQATEDIYANIFLIALNKQLDMYPILNECEYLCEHDERISATHYFAPKPLEKSVVILSLLAEKMGCSIADFFISRQKRQEMVYKFLKETLKDKIDSREEVQYLVQVAEEESKTYLDEDVKKLSRISLNLFHHSDEGKIDNMNMEYHIDRILFEDGNCTYTFTVEIGDTVISLEPLEKMQVYNYLYKGSYIWYEDEGYMVDIFEKVYEDYINTGGIVMDFVL